MTVRRPRVVAAVAVLATAVTFEGCAARTGTVGEAFRPDGPLRSVSEHAWAIGVDPDTTFTDGLETLNFDADGEVELQNVRLLGDSGLELVGVSLADPERTIGSVQYMETYPPRHRDLKGHIVDDGLGTPLAARTPNDIGWELLLGIRATEPGRHVRTGIEVTYTHDGHTFRETLPALLAVCVGRSIGFRDCDLPDLSID
ncbi:hypothetical protein [Nocardioides sp.]|uniref:hypothetical protein n=1 Tax=Nocardioides sp. TaxID=35761 RepID=UPI00262A0BC5|nr:hypothetical protein [Nocardioides sp.]MDI6911146.1 hypothetical protein [Nocardioides sp.]